jgi:hypothetical protein
MFKPPPEYQLKSAPNSPYVLWFNNIMPNISKYLKQLQLVEFLIGFDISPTGRLILDSGNPAPRLVSPFNSYLEKVNRFLFGGGLVVDLVNAKTEDARQIWLTSQLKRMRLNTLANLAWRRGATTGEVAIVFTQATSENGEASMYFNTDLFDYPEFTPECDQNGNLLAIHVLASRFIDGEEMIFKATYARDGYTFWEPVPVDKASNKEWLASGKFTPHNYRRVPGVVIRNKLEDPKARGLSDFDKAACDIATELILQEVNSCENHWFFGHPFISSDDPDNVLEAIRMRSQVLQAGSKDDGGHPIILNPPTMPESHERLIERLQRNLADHLGVSSTIDQTPNEMSSLTLRLLNAATISVAEDKWANYVVEGLEPLLGTMLVAAGAEGVLAGVWASDPSTHEVKISRAQPYFPTAPAEKQALLSVAEQLVSLGVKREVALAREYFTDLTIEQVGEMLDANFVET